MTEVSEFVRDTVRRHEGLLIPTLQDIQERYNYLPEKVLRELAKISKISLSDVYGVASFYSAFSFTPKGKHIITVCLGTACHVRGGAKVVDVISKELGIESGETTADLQFTLQTANCLGCCAIGPIVLIDGEYYGQMTPQKTVVQIERLLKKEKKSG
ncbi:MAG: NAD(P)H-dependent oxidoreductase subunit E [bacterium]